MPDDKSISELTTAEQQSGGDLFEIAIPNALSDTGYLSRKVSATELANLLLKQLLYTSDLTTTAKTIIPAINEAAQSGGGASVVQKTMAEYTALPSAAKMNGSIYKITDKALIYCLDEEYHAVKEITSADYALLTSDEKNNGTLYIITDEETTADDIPYSSGVSVADKLDNVPTYEEGSSGNFKYRKWSDGTLEMWGYKEDTDTVTLVTWGSWYGCDFNGLGQYPIAFTSIHYINGNVVIDGYNGISSIVYPTTLTNAPAYIWDRGTTIASGTRRYRRYLYVKGTWN